ncbi:MAG: diacylglycerol kinase family protein [Bacteroidetes bacterium]|nr:diacylglycerol kinase family protein [Bacteroidota bacterium]
MTYLKKRKNAFKAAFSGLYQAFKSEAHLKIHLLIAILVIVAGLYFAISKSEWFAVSLCIVLVISLELINSAMEKMCDLYTKEYDQRIKYIKDVAAGTVLVASIFAAMVGLFVFVPYVLILLEK